MTWQKVKLGDLWKESRIESNSPNSEKRIKVRLNVQGVEKRPDRDDEQGATKYFIRKSGQFIYGRQNFHKGAFGIVPQELDGFESSSDIPAFDISPECNPEWLYYFFKQDNLYKKLEKYAKGTGSKRIHPDKIEHLEILLPPRKEQDRILEKMKSQEKKGQDLQDINNSNESLISSLRQSILQSAVQGKLVKQNSKDEPASELLKKIKSEKEKLIKEGKIRKDKLLAPISEDEIPYELPTGWEWVRLGEIFRFIDYRGKTPPKISSGIRLITAKNVKQGYISLEPQEFISESIYPKWMTRGFPQIGDLLITTEAPLGHVAIFDLQEKVAFAQRVIIFQKFVDLNSPFLKYMLISEPIQKLIIGKQSGMTAKGIKSSKLKTIIVPLPPLAEQKRIVERVDKLMNYCDELEKQVKENQENAEKLMSAVLKEWFEDGN